MLATISMLISVIMYALTGRMIFVWLTILAGLAGITLGWAMVQRSKKEHIDNLVQKCIEDLKKGWR